MSEDEDAGGIDLEYFLADISEESSTRIAGAISVSYTHLTLPTIVSV